MEISRDFIFYLYGVHEIEPEIERGPRAKKFEKLWFRLSN